TSDECEHETSLRYPQICTHSEGLARAGPRCKRLRINSVVNRANPPRDPGVVLSDLIGDPIGYANHRGRSVYAETHSFGDPLDGTHHPDIQAKRSCQPAGLRPEDLVTAVNSDGVHMGEHDRSGHLDNAPPPSPYRER